MKDRDADPPSLAEARHRIRTLLAPDEGETLGPLLDGLSLDGDACASIARDAESLVTTLRKQSDPGLMEVFLAEYGLSTSEGVALMCLAEALLRVPDADTIDDLIEDKIAASAWARHLGQSSSPLVNASTWALMLTGSVLSEDGDGVVGSLRAAVRRLGEPVIRTAVARAMRELGAQFVLGRDIDEAMERAAEQEARGYSYSYDMLGEGARTDADALRYHLAYARAIAALAVRCHGHDVRANPGISVKLSALHPRYESGHHHRVMAELVPRVLSLAVVARSAGMGFNIDAEEADRLDLSLDVIEAVVASPALAGWDGFGVVVQAYGRRAMPVIDWLYALAERNDRRLMVRLVKGAYWDTEVKRAQVEGLSAYPVFTRKPSTDLSWIACAERLLARRDRLYPQFATHNAHSVAAITHMAGNSDDYEFQRLHGMGEALHEQVRVIRGQRCRIYAPVGAHRDLLAYLVRRLLENGANSSFVSRLLDANVPPAEVVADPLASALATRDCARNPAIALPVDLFGAERRNSAGVDLRDPSERAHFDAARDPWRGHRWRGGPLVAGGAASGHEARNARARPVLNPALPTDCVGHLRDADAPTVTNALAAAAAWSAPVSERAETLRRAADAYEAGSGELCALLHREAGKTPADAVAEIREAVDFLRYYAVMAEAGGEDAPLGVVTCISPWNFPLAIFTGQIAAALAAGNAVIAKPAEQTALIGHRAVRHLHQAGVPRSALQYLPGPGDVVGAAVASHPGISGVCFTGSTMTAGRIATGIAQSLPVHARFIAETGGLNAMVVDSTALHEQAVRDIVDSAFRSAGQRCSALRLLYVQEEVADDLLTMLYGALDELTVADPWSHATDVGPLIDAEALAPVVAYVQKARSEGRLLKQLAATDAGHFLGPAIVAVRGMEDLVDVGEVFAPVLHVARFTVAQLESVLDAVNDAGYGLTFGLHTRIDDRVQHVVEKLHVGNLYVNRNQIGAMVGVQPFGGEGLSGTGPKAGGPHYVKALRARERGQVEASVGNASADGNVADIDAVQRALGTARPASPVRSVMQMPGPTGESNQLHLVPRGVILCLGPGREAALAQCAQAHAAGCAAVAVAVGLMGDEGVEGTLDPRALTTLEPLDMVVSWADDIAARAARIALAARAGPLVPLVTDAVLAPWCVRERHVCIDTTAAGGNASLLAGAG